MTRIIGFLLSFSLFVSSCAPGSKTVTITANIENSSAPSAKVFNNSIEIEAEITDGSFSTSFDIDQPQYVNLRIGRESTELFITPGQELSISIDVQNFDESVSYSGKGAESSQYLAAKYLDQEENQISGPDLYSMDEEKFLKTLEEQESKGIEFLNQFSKQNNLPKSFKEIEEQNIAFQQNASKLSYESAHKYYAKVEDFKISEEFQNHINQVDLNQAQLLQAPQFQSFINSLLMNKAYSKFLEDQEYQRMGKIGIVKAQLDMIPDVITDPQVSEFATNSAVMNHLSYGSALGIESFMDQLKGMTSSPQVFEKIKMSMEEWGHLAKGKAAPNFEGKTLEGQSVNLSDLKGKHVYIDVWATWCGPCKAEQPALFALEDQYKDNENIAFVGMSIDENKEAWQKMVSEKDMMGIQIISDKAWESSICIDYKIKGIPRFILIDKDGKIINADAPRPSSDQIKEILKELAGQPLLTVL